MIFAQPSPRIAAIDSAWTDAESIVQSKALEMQALSFPVSAVVQGAHPSDSNWTPVILAPNLDNSGQSSVMSGMIFMQALGQPLNRNRTAFRQLGTDRSDSPSAGSVDTPPGQRRQL